MGADGFIRTTSPPFPGVTQTVTADGKYAFVAGRNTTKLILGEPQAGGNIGIIKDPLGPNPQLVAATEPVPEHFTNNVALSSDGKYLIGSYFHLDGSGQACVFNVEEIIKTVENPGGSDLTEVAVIGLIRTWVLIFLRSVLILWGWL